MTILRPAILSLRRQDWSYIRRSTTISAYSTTSFENPNSSVRSFSTTLLRQNQVHWFSQRCLVSTNSLPLIWNRIRRGSDSFIFGVRGFATRMGDAGNRPPKETILLDGCDFEHWLVVVEKPDPQLTRDEIIDSYIKTLAKVVGSEEEARMKIYSVSTRHYFAFGALVSEELSYKLKELPNVRWVLPDSYLDVKNKNYGGEPFIDGQAVPYDPKYHELWLHNYYKSMENNNKNKNRTRRDNFRNSTSNRAPSHPQPSMPLHTSQTPNSLNNNQMPGAGSQNLASQPFQVPNHTSPLPPPPPSPPTHTPQTWNPAPHYQNLPPQAPQNQNETASSPSPLSSLTHDANSWISAPGYQNQSPHPSQMPAHTPSHMSIHSSQAWSTQNQNSMPSSGYSNHSRRLPVSNDNFSAENMLPRATGRDLPSPIANPAASPKLNPVGLTPNNQNPSHFSSAGNPNQAGLHAFSSENFSNQNTPPQDQQLPSHMQSPRSHGGTMLPPQQQNDFRYRGMPQPVEINGFQNAYGSQPGQNQRYQRRTCPRWVREIPWV
ncbi:hypothetical protein Nepgr_000195 [Nepenthes gracilis]|uniref:MORF/ORRM1/DAG-like MORF domain-containing protein n=1 Tax=Nepenthes gracilis TaxID=150966 RepID=A0AAD3RW78_NEPGR|nr:hypothetical protein Nepgr_000195 [Nepenthes gracilis]